MKRCKVQIYRTLLYWWLKNFFFLTYTTKWKLYSSFVKVWIFFPFQLQIVCPMLKFSILGKPFHARGEDKRRTHEKTFCQFFSSVPLPLLHIFAIVKINHWNKNSEIRKFFRLTFQRLFVTTFHYIIWLTQHGVIQFISFSRKSNSDTYGFGHVLCTHFFAPPLAFSPWSLPRTGVSFRIFFTLSDLFFVRFWCFGK